MPPTWILLANGHRARFMQHDRADGSLVEIAGFIYPAASLANGGARFEPATGVEEKAHSRFARQLADYLNKAVANRQCDRVALIASGPMLGVLRPMLLPRTTELLVGSVDRDLTLYQGSELQQRVRDALGPLA